MNSITSSDLASDKSLHSETTESASLCFRKQAWGWWEGVQYSWMGLKDGSQGWVSSVIFQIKRPREGKPLAQAVCLSPLLWSLHPEPLWVGCIHPNPDQPLKSRRQHVIGCNFPWASFGPPGALLS